MSPQFFIVVLLSYMSLAVLTVNHNVYSQTANMIQGVSTFDQNVPTPEQWANRGIELFEQGDYKKAINYLFESWRLSPKKTEQFEVFSKNLSVAHNNYAREVTESGDYELAFRLIRKAIFFDKTNQTARNNLELIYKSQNLDSGNYEVRLAEARKLRKSGYLEESIADYLSVYESTQDNPKLHNQITIELAQVYQVLYSKYIKSPIKQVLFTEAEDLIQQAIQYNTDDIRPYIMLGRIYLSNQQLAESIEQFNKVLTIESANKTAQYNLVQAWKQVVELAPHEKNNLTGYGSALIKAGQVEEGNKYLAKAEAMNVNAFTQQSNGGNPVLTAVEPKTIKEQIQVNNNPVLAQKANYALSLYKQGKYQESIVEYKTVLARLKPDQSKSDIYYNLALAYERTKKYSLAMQSLKKSLKINSQNTDSKKALERISTLQNNQRQNLLKEAQDYIDKQNYQEAQLIYKSMLQDNSNDSEIHYKLAQTLESQDLLPEALRHYQRAMSLDKDNQDYSQAYNKLNTAINNGIINTNQSLKITEKAVKLQNSQKYTEAIQEYLRALSLDKNNVSAHYNLGTTYHIIDEYSLAIQYYQNAYNLDPANYTEALYYMGILQEAQGNKDKALSLYREYLEKYPSGEFAKAIQDNIQQLRN